MHAENTRFRSPQKTHGMCRCEQRGAECVREEDECVLQDEGDAGVVVALIVNQLCQQYEHVCGARSTESLCVDLRHMSAHTSVPYPSLDANPAGRDKCAEGNREGGEEPNPGDQRQRETKMCGFGGGTHFAFVFVPSAQKPLSVPLICAQERALILRYSA